MRVIVCDNYEEMSSKAADIFAAKMVLNPECVLGLATGSTPIGMYNKLAEMNKAGKIDFSKVRTFNLDEYYPIKRDNDQSYYYFMNENLFSKVNIDPLNTNIPNGEAMDPVKECKAYDEKLRNAGGCDIQVLGIGQNGHIAFNEPDAALNANTHLTGLTESTIKANARFFESEADVPTQALTMGIASIMSAKTIILLANGANKAAAVAELLTSDITTSNPATLLKVHPDVILLCDKEAYSQVK